MRKILSIFLLIAPLLPVNAQKVLSLDSCRSLAMRNNKQLSISKLKQEMAHQTRQAVKTQYLPKVDALAGYEYFSKEVSILNNTQKGALSNLGTNLGARVSSNFTNILTNLTQNNLITPAMANQISSVMNEVGGPMAQAGNEIGQTIREAFRTDTRNMWAGSVLLRQPVYMGGAITAANKIAQLSENLTSHETEGQVQNTLYHIDQAYWTVVSLKHKQKLANSYRDLVQKLDDDVYKMIREGVATRADGLKVDVSVNEADMQVTVVDDGLTLAKMYLCQLCGLPMEEEILLTDEDREELAPLIESFTTNTETALEQRYEMKMLQNTIDISREATKLIRAEYLPHVALTGGYLISNPNVFNGFERKFSGVWNVGVLVQVPVWNWFEGKYKINASKAATNIAQMEMSEAREKIELQISQGRYKVKEAGKRLMMSRKNVERADENLRSANLGFHEGVMDATDVMAAQTAWQQAKSQKIDAEIEVILSQIALRKALGELKN